MRHLAEAWLRTAAHVGARGDVAGAGANLLARYAEGHRRYHDLGHLDDVLRHVDELAHLSADADAVRLGAWFHDAVYDPARDDNEERSARLAETLLSGLAVPDPVGAEVARLVRVTTGHEPMAGDANGEVLCDADLAVLAGDEAAYDRYARAVREEYAHLDDHAFAAGRSRILRELLGREALFHTPDGRTAWEPAARRNLAAELARLTP